MHGREHHIIAREGWLTLGILIIFTIISYVYLNLWWFLLFALLILVTAYIYRDPRRNIPSAPLAIVSPASGKIVSIDTTKAPCISTPAERFRIKLSLWDVHSLCSPTEGKVMNEWSIASDIPGYDKQYVYWIKTDEGDDVLFSVFPGKWLPYLKVGLHSGERIGQGQRCGFLYYSGMVDVYLPKNSRKVSEAGEQINSGATILGQLIHENGASAINN